MRLRTGIRALSALAGAAAASYVVYVGAAWLRYGQPRRPAPAEADDLLDGFMPRYDVAERHSIEVDAPAAVTFAALMDVSLEDSMAIRAIFKGRELLLGARSGERFSGHFEPIHWTRRGRLRAPKPGRSRPTPLRDGNSAGTGPGSHPASY